MKTFKVKMLQNVVNMNGKKWLMIFCLLLCILPSIGCSDGGGSDDEPELVSDKEPYEWVSHPLAQHLIGTSWKYTATTDDFPENADYGIGSVLTFSDIMTDGGGVTGYYKLYINGEDDGFRWCVNDDNYLWLPNSSSSKSARFSQINGLYAVKYPDEFIELSDSKIKVCRSSSGDTYTYTRCSTPSLDNGDSGGNSPSYEKPDVSFYDYDANYTSLKVTYKLWNSSEAKVSSAKIYYGTSSNPSTSKTATVSSALITATITGLKRGTTYYVKCVATGKGGTTTTETTRCMTLH